MAESKDDFLDQSAVGAGVWMVNKFEEAQPGVKDTSLGPPPYDEDSKYRDGGGAGWLPSNMSMRPIWVPGVITEVDEEEKAVTTMTSIGSPGYKWGPEKVIPHARDTAVGHKDNCLDLMYENMPELLWNTQKRYTRDQVFSFVGKSLLALNPNKSINPGNASTWRPMTQQLQTLYRGTKTKFIDIYNPVVQRLYAESEETRTSPLPPHIYSVASEALTNLLKKKVKSQMILLAGSPGSGKSTNAKIILDFVVTTTSKAPPRAKPSDYLDNDFQLDGAGLSKAEEYLLSMQIILESFGNACTTRNPNSTRMGKLTKMYFNDDGNLICSEVVPLLLERSRVIKFPEDERNFNVFYQLLAGKRDDVTLGLKAALDYELLWGGNQDPAMPAETADRVDDKGNFDRLCKALSVFGFDKDKQREIWQILSGLLSLGDLSFHSGVPTGSPPGTPSVTALHSKHEASLAHAAKMLGYDDNGTELEEVLCSRLHRNTDFVALSLQEAQEKKMLLIKAIYAGLFQAIVDTVNAKMLAEAGPGFEPKKSLHLGVLDLCGLDSAASCEANGLEQMLANVAAEKLNGLIIEKLFKEEEQQCKDEGITLQKAAYTDNEAVVNLFTKQRVGLIDRIDESTKYPENDIGMLKERLFRQFKEDPCFAVAKPKLNEDMTKDEMDEEKARASKSFVVKHSSGEEVQYHVEGQVPAGKDFMAPTGFLSTNRHSHAYAKGDPQTGYALEDDMGDFFDGSALSLMQNDIKTCLGLGVKGTGGKQLCWYGRATWRTKSFKNVLKAVFEGTKMADSKYTDLHYIFCVRPNASNLPNFMSPNLVHKQLESLNVLNMIRHRHTGFDYRQDYRKFIVRYLPIVAKNQFLKWPPEKGVTLKALSHELLRVMLLMLKKDLEDYEDDAKLGKKMIFVRYNVITMLEKLRTRWQRHSHNSAELIQRRWRRYLGDKRYKEMKLGFERLQASWRSMHYQKQWKERVVAVDRIDNCVKNHFVRTYFQNTRNAALTTQKFYKIKKQRLQWLRIRRGLRVMHSLARGFVVRQHVLRMLYAVRTIQRAVRAWLVRFHEYWKKVKCCLMIQCHYRGKVWRHDHPDIMDWLNTEQQKRDKRVAMDTIEDMWKTILMRRRFRELREAALCLQHWCRTLILRNNFIKYRHAVRYIQKFVRGWIARRYVDKMRSFNMVCDMMWRLRTVREREALQLHQLLRKAPVEPPKDIKEKRRHQAVMLHRVVDVDTVVDTSDIYPTGWTHIAGMHEDTINLMGKHTVQIQAGASHTVMLTDAGEVYTYGWGDYGQLGHQNNGNQDRPMLVQALAGARPSDLIFIKQIAAGEDHTMALSSAGRVYSWGSNLRGQLGVGDLGPHQRSLSTPRMVERITRRVAQIASGAFHSVALVAAGSVYTWGSGAQLGIGVFTGRGDRALPCCVKALMRFRVRHIAAGPAFTAAVSHAGEVYTWGDGEHGELGHGVGSNGKCHNKLTPHLVEGLKRFELHSRISSVACGGRHMMAISSTGRLYAWGCGYGQPNQQNTGQLGLGDMKEALTPMMIDRLKPYRVVHVGCGWRHTVCITDDHTVFAWGVVSCVQGRSQSLPEEADDYDITVNIEKLPKVVPLPWLAGRTAKAIMVDYSHMFSVTGILYSQGAGKPTSKSKKIDERVALATGGTLAKEHHLLRKEKRVLATVDALVRDFEGAIVKVQEGDGWVSVACVNLQLANSISAARGAWTLAHELKRRGIEAMADASSQADDGSVPMICPLRDLKEMSAPQLRSLVAMMQGTRPPAPAPALEGPADSKYTALGHHAYGGSFSPTLNRAKPAQAHRERSALRQESKARTELLKFQHIDEELPPPMHTMLPPPTAVQVSDPHVSPRQKHAIAKRRMEQRRKAEAAARAKALAKWRETRENPTRNVNIASLFTPDLLVTASNDDLTIQMTSSNRYQKGVHGMLHTANTPSPQQMASHRGLTVSDMIQRSSPGASGTSNFFAEPGAVAPPPVAPPPASPPPAPTPQPVQPPPAAAYQAPGSGAKDLEGEVAALRARLAAAKSDYRRQHDAPFEQALRTNQAPSQYVPPPPEDGHIDNVIDKIKAKAAQDVASLWGSDHAMPSGGPPPPPPPAGGSSYVPPPPGPPPPPQNDMFGYVQQYDGSRDYRRGSQQIPIPSNSALGAYSTPAAPAPRGGYY